MAVQNPRAVIVGEYVNQWLFPLSEPSSFNFAAPILSGKDISAFRNNQELQDRLVKSFEVMLDFYGYQILFEEKEITISKSREHETRIKKWVTPSNHNFLRITRILKSMTILGLSRYALEFFSVLEELYTQKGDLIGANSFLYWQKAINKS